MLAISSKPANGREADMGSQDDAHRWLRSASLHLIRQWHCFDRCQTLDWRMHFIYFD